MKIPIHLFRDGKRILRLLEDGTTARLAFSSLEYFLSYNEEAKAKVIIHPTEADARAAAGETKEADSKYPAWLRAEIAAADAPDAQALARKIALVLRKAGCAPTQFSTSQEALEHVTALIAPVLQPTQP